MSSNKEIQFRSALSAMIDHIKSSVKLANKYTNDVELCGAAHVCGLWWGWGRGVGRVVVDDGGSDLHSGSGSAVVSDLR